MVRVLPTLAAVAAFLAPVLAQDFKLYGINYNIRAGPDAAPPAEKCKSATQIEKELQILKSVTDIVRIYSLVDCDQATAAVPAIINAGLKLELGLWVGPNNDVYAAEREKFKELVKNTALVNSTSVVSIHVGSEAIYREDVNASTAIANLHEIKQIAADANLTVPVSIGDIGDSYLAYPDLFKEVDFVSANLFPFWEKVEADKAADHFYERYQKVATEAAKYKKTVVIGETGWPTNGTHAGASKASPENAATFFSDFYTLAKEHDLKYYYFAGFDEAWKLHNEAADSTVEGYFGIFTADGVLKPEFAELKLDSDDSDDSSNADAEEAGETEEEGDDEASEDEDDDNTLPLKTKPPVKKLHIKVKFNKHH